LKIAWISYFPIEWLPDLPAALRNLPMQHAASWQRVLLDEIKGAPNLKLHIIAVRRQFPQHCAFEREGVTFHCLKLPRGMRSLSVFWWETLLIRRCLKEIKPDLVHAWGTERAAALVASRLAFPYLVTMQGLLQWHSQQVAMNRYQRFEAWLERPALRRASVVTTESSFAIRWLSEHYPHLELHQIEHASQWLFHRLQRQPQTQPPQLLCVAPLTLIKGVDLLFQALDRLKGELDFRLTIVGAAEPAMLAKLKAITAAALWDRVTLRSGLGPEQIAHELARATLMVLPTRADTSPNSVKEAVVSGLPVVASAVVGIVDYVIPGKNGFTFPPNSVPGLVEAIRAALAHPLFVQGKVDAQTLGRMREYLSPKVMGEKFLAVYRRVFERSHPPR
jgi:glycosyltransferase involved in cell wall biosynthesis